MTDRVYPPVIGLAKIVFRLLGLRWQIVGAQHIPKTGGAVLASNHVSYLDFTLCGFAALHSHRLVRFMAKDAVFKNRWVGPLMRGMHHIPVDRAAGAQAFAAAVRALRAGEVVGLFPEATISQSFVLKSFKLGAARMAIDAGVPIIPMITWGGQRILTKGGRRSLRRRRTIMITVGEPIQAGPTDKAGTLTLQLHTRMAELLADTLARYPDPPDKPGDLWWLPAELGGTAPTPAEAAVLDGKIANDRSMATPREKPVDPDPAG
ncbi:MAG: 1-acyl-sn-glycerol-3-phosphate acyltransferase [Geodermatophilaceae bacterium]|nr:1-acyl-sn-glycerol-3-phosphate acyltransferase [Geodermatophilaceae bacterium]